MMLLQCSCPKFRPTNFRLREAAGCLQPWWMGSGVTTVFTNNVVIDIQCNCMCFVPKQIRNLSGLGCVACCASKLPGVFGEFAWQGSGQDGRLCAMKVIKHHHSKDHKRAAATFFGFADDGLTGPSMEEMREQLRLQQLGTPCGTSTKPRAMTWCLRSNS